jgi:phage tail protein X
VQDVQSGGGGSRFQIVTFTSFTPPSPGNTNGTTEQATLLAPNPFEPMPRRRPRNDQAQYPAASVYVGDDGDTIESLAKQFYGKATPAGERAIVGANAVLRQAKGPADMKIVPDAVYWIPWNPEDHHTVSDFLVAANRLIVAERGAAAIPIRFHYAWWEIPKYVYQIWMIGTFVLVGVIWPGLIQLLIKGGFGRAPADEYDLSRFKGGAPEPAAAPKAPVVTQSDMDRLRELEESMAATLKASGSPAPAVVASAAPEPTVVKTLAGGPATAAPAPPQPGERESYDGGEFYPVAIPHKKTDEKK